MSSIAVAAYIALFVAVGLLFVFVNLLIGRFVRPSDPHDEKLEIYECGEPTIGSSFVQFDLRFYVVALLFLIFDVEIAFFFPWATVFGKANNLRDPALLTGAVVQPLERELALARTFQELGIPPEARPGVAEAAAIQEHAGRLAWFSVLDILVFFGVVLVGFAYVWMRGDIDWVRAVSEERKGTAAPRAPPGAPQGEEEAVLA